MKNDSYTCKRPIYDWNYSIEKGKVYYCTFKKDKVKILLGTDTSYLDFITIDKFMFTTYFITQGEIRKEKLMRINYESSL